MTGWLCESCKFQLTKKRQESACTCDHCQTLILKFRLQHTQYLFTKLFSPTIFNHHCFHCTFSLATLSSCVLIYTWSPGPLLSLHFTFSFSSTCSHPHGRWKVPNSTDDWLHWWLFDALPLCSHRSWQVRVWESDTHPQYFSILDIFEYWSFHASPSLDWQ